jgi:hypothetical protein
MLTTISAMPLLFWESCKATPMNNTNHCHFSYWQWKFGFEHTYNLAPINPRKQAKIAAHNRLIHMPIKNYISESLNLNQPCWYSEVSAKKGLEIHSVFTWILLVCNYWKLVNCRASVQKSWFLVTTEKNITLYEPRHYVLERSWKEFYITLTKNELRHCQKAPSHTSFLPLTWSPRLPKSSH